MADIASTTHPEPAPRGAVLLTRAEALEAGITDRVLRESGAYRRVLHGLYTPADVPLSHELRCQAAARLLPSDAVITGRSAATLHGARLADHNDAVEVLVNDKYVNRRGGLKCWARSVSTDEHSAWSGIRLASPCRSSFEMLARYPLRWAVANCDRMLHEGMVEENQLRRFLGERNHYGIRQARAAFELLDRRAESLPESMLRVLLVQRGLPPTPQLNILHRGRFVARVDLAYEDAKVALEYEGAWHADAEQYRRDRMRRQRIVECGWQVLVVTARELFETPNELLRRVGAALGRV
ncbi:Transcriptional regulator, AbiEi antitoxin, Type IV TA system [Actinopolyspora mzabensis]|uniref:Transcriptional regulator, AbiEi antitoxin, Type IV TA system n=1 Tax=Actinopolyspora mzabensis TaxID=995066 RepID=A0A1G8WHR5_ACTMZ|nr:hypothetical protein [Actinopolyspora mzabensis]SDJ77859.1 Transcriptional regulator, AbiEi antitoxin, Type IV TA system [Actinopolyspora mzabensis]